MPGVIIPPRYVLSRLTAQSVVAVPKSGRSFWIDDIRGEQRWETFILEELPTSVAEHAALDGPVALIGVSMGGLGVLRLALKHPHRYVAVAALEPGIESAMTWDEVDIDSTGVRDGALFERFHGSPVDPHHFALNHPPALIAPQAEAILRREALTRLDAALASIEVGRRTVLVLHEIEEMTAPEIAQVLGIPLNTVYSRLRVARVELEEALSQLGGEP